MSLRTLQSLVAVTTHGCREQEQVNQGAKDQGRSGQRPYPKAPGDEEQADQARRKRGVLCTRATEDAERRRSSLPGQLVALDEENASDVQAAVHDVFIDDHQPESVDQDVNGVPVRLRRNGVNLVVLDADCIFQNADGVRNVVVSEGMLTEYRRNVDTPFQVQTLHEVTLSKRRLLVNLARSRRPNVKSEKPSAAPMQPKPSKAATARVAVATRRLPRVWRRGIVAWPWRPVLVVLLAWASLLALSSSPALAARGHEFAGAFGWGVRSGASELQRCVGEVESKPSTCQVGISGDGPGQFKDPDGIAVNEATGEIYVVDKANNRVEVFNSAGTELEGEINGSGTLSGEGGKAAGSGTVSTGAAAEVPTGEFEEPEEIAVDNSCFQLHLAEPKCKEEDPSNGDVYVVDASPRAETKTSHPVIDKYGPKDEYIGQITRNLNGSEFAGSGFRQLYGVAVDPRGEVWVEEENFGEVNDGAASYTDAERNEWIEFHSTEGYTKVGTKTIQSAVAAPGFAVGADPVGAEDDLYVHNTFGEGDRVAKFTAQGELLSGEVDEGVPTGVAVEESTGDVYIAHEGGVDRVNASAVSFTSQVGVSLETLSAGFGGVLGAVAVDSSSLTVFVADSVGDRVDVFSPEAAGPPRVVAASEAVTDVSSTSASFAAEVNPRSEEGDQVTRYAFRYGACASAAACPGTPFTGAVPDPEGALVANYEPDRISAHVVGLAPGTVYHVSVTAHNAHGAASGDSEEVIFTTQGSGVAGLPDGRRWELVSPVDKHGALIEPQGVDLTQAAAGGDAFSYGANAPTEAGPEGFSVLVQVLSRRGPRSWESQDISTPHEAPAGFAPGASTEYHAFSADLSTALVEPQGPFTQQTSPQASEQTLYLRDDFPAGDPSDPCTSACYRPLVTGCPGAGQPCPKPVEEAADVPEGTRFGQEGDGSPFFLGATPDLSHVVFEAGAKLTADAPPQEGGGSHSLYEWAAGRLELVSVLPGGQAVSPAALPTLGRRKPGSGGGRITRNAISDDGSRVVFSEGNGSHHLYLRQTTAGEEATVKLDSPEPGCGVHCSASSPGPVFQTASADGSRVFFTDSQPLTAGAGDGDLYECQIEETEEGVLACRLSDLTVPEAGEAGVLGLVAGAAEDGSSVYFTANGRLTSQPGPHGETAVAGNCNGNTSVGTFESETSAESCNLYERVGGQTRLIAVLSGADFPDWSLQGGYGLRGLTDRVSPDGRYLAFMSRRALSGYDNRDAVSGKPDEEVYLYDSETNRLLCASCDPTGARPHGVQYSHIDAEAGGLAGGPGIWPEGAWIAANVPGWSMLDEPQGFAVYQSRYLNDEGRLFFNSSDALVPQDVNNTEDVYEYEPPAVGDCNEAQATYSPASAGCVALISSGTAKEESAFLDASESGDDVFFLTRQRLLPKQDTDTSLDVYDAHACTSESPCLPEPPEPQAGCEGDSCLTPVTPPEDQTPDSLTYQGPGNQPPPTTTTTTKPRPTACSSTAGMPSKTCTKQQNFSKALAACKRKYPHNKKKRGSCDAAARHKYAPKAAKKAKAKKSTRGTHR